MRFVLISDDDGHWYICPQDRQSEADKYFEKVAEYMDDFESCALEPELPEYLTPVNGSPSLVSFTDWQVD